MGPNGLAGKIAGCRKTQNRSFRPPFTKGGGFQKGKALCRTPQSAETLSSGAFLRARELFASEKVLENQLFVQTDLKNYPVDDF